MEHFVGIDLHKYVSQLAVLRESRSPSHLRFANDVVTVERILKKLPNGSKIALEAMGSWWWLVELAQKTGHEVFLSHPKQTQAIASARLKSDKVDALMLAKLLKADLLPTVWIPPENQRHVRELLAHRARLVRQRTAVINELRAVYAKRNIDPEAKLQRVRPTVSGADDLSGYGPRIVGEDLELLGFVHRQMGGLDKELIKIALEDAHAQRLMTIPGVGPVSAVAMSCWIGEIGRFSNAKKLASYFGLAPRVRQSADTERHGHITKEGNRMVRTLVIQAALVHTRRGRGAGRKHYLGVLKRRGKQIARVALLKSERRLRNFTGDPRRDSSGFPIETFGNDRGLAELSTRPRNLKCLLKGLDGRTSTHSSLEINRQARIFRASELNGVLDAVIHEKFSGGPFSRPGSTRGPTSMFPEFRKHGSIAS